MTTQRQTRLAIGDRTPPSVTGQRKDSESGRWIATTGRQKAQRYRARATYRSHEGIVREMCRYGSTVADARAALERAIDDALSGSVDMTSGMSFVAAGRQWLEHMKRQSETGAGVSASTAELYEWTFDKYIDAEDSQVRGMSLQEANHPQRLRRFLQDVADRYGTSTAKTVRSVVSGIFKLAVSDGVLSHNCMRDVEPVKSTAPAKTRKGKASRDTSRAFTRAERDKIIAYGDAQAAETGLDPRTLRKRQAVVELAAFMAGTGVRISEARCLTWGDVDLAGKRVEIRGTKTKFSHRALTLPVWLVKRLRAWKLATGGEGYVFAAPTFVVESRRLDEPRAGQVEWEESNCLKAMRSLLDGAGFEWATGHSFRRTVATLASEAGAPLQAVADQLGHADPHMTASVYLGRDPFGERASVAAHL